MILTGAENIYPLHHEPAFTALPGVRAAALVGIPDRFGDDELWLAVELLPDGDEPAVRRAVLASEHGARLPIRGVIFLRLPYSGRSAKLVRAELRRQVSRAIGRHP
jgi:acyl-CoA synthetase (AMP-forming)/AMP-acid ligase II